MYTQSLDLTTCLSFESCDSGNAAGGVGLMISYIAVYISYDFGNLQIRSRYRATKGKVPPWAVKGT